MGANLGVLASLMQTMTPTMPQYNPMEEAQQQTLLQGRRLGNQTDLLQLAELRRQQEEAAAARAFLQQHPELVIQGGMPTSTLRSLNAGGPPGAITQGPLPGMPGQTQTIGAPQDLSRYAGVSPQGGGPLPAGVGMPTVTPPPSVLGSLGSQPPAPQDNPLLELARRHPGAAALVQQQMHGQDDLRMKREEQRLTMGTKVLEYVGRVAQGVTDQASLDAARAELARVHPQAAAHLPQVYSKEAMAPFLAKALDVKESLTLQAQDLQAQAAVIRARKEGRSVDVDNQLRAMGVQPGQETAAQMKEALQAVQEGKIAVSASHGTGQLVQTPQGIVRVNPRTGTVDPVEAPGGGPMYPKPTAEEQRAASYGDRAKAAHDTAVALENKGLTPGIWSKVGEALPFGMGNYLVGEDQQRYRQTVNQFAQAILRKESGAAISPTEYTMTERTYFPQPGDSKKTIQQKREERDRVIQSMYEEGKQTGRTGGQPQDKGASGGQTSQAPSASQGPATFDRADFLRWRQGTGKSGNPTEADVEAYFQARGLKRR